jgi:hypothetical protein
MRWRLARSTASAKPESRPQINDLDAMFVPNLAQDDVPPGPPDNLNAMTVIGPKARSVPLD